MAKTVNLRASSGDTTENARSREEETHPSSLPSPYKSLKDEFGEDSPDSPETLS
jgi:hypothetical protein